MLISQLNVFQIWRESGERVPFAVRRDSWNPESFFIVTSIEIKKFPYGSASGYFVSYRDSKHLADSCFEVDLVEVEKNSEFTGLSSAGCYEWVRVPLKIILKVGKRL
jgi:hypothetical protein